MNGLTMAGRSKCITSTIFRFGFAAGTGVKTLPSKRL